MELYRRTRVTEPRRRIRSLARRCLEIILTVSYIYITFPLGESYNHQTRNFGMAKAAGDIADELNEILRKTGQPYVTLTWPAFYRTCERERLKQPFLNVVQSEASGRFQLIVAYGQNAVLVCHDRNFAGETASAAAPPL